jgi:phosphomannomutase
VKANPTIYREYDIRGVAGKDFDESFVEALGRAYGSKLKRRNITRAAVGRDCRMTSPTYHKILKAAIRSTGVDVVDIGMCPTPLMYFSVFHLDLMGGIHVTGSHNPPDQNGFKIVVGKSTIHGAEIQELREMIDRGQGDRGNGAEEAYPIIPAYQGYLTGAVRSLRQRAARRRRLRERHRRARGAGDLPRHGLRGHRALQRARWPLPQPSSRSHCAGKRARADCDRRGARRRSRHCVRRRL